METATADSQQSDLDAITRPTLINGTSGSASIHSVAKSISVRGPKRPQRSPERTLRNHDSPPPPIERLEVAEAPTENAVDYPSGIKFASVIMAVGLALILTGLDIGIIATAVPSITNQFHTIEDIGWYYSAYRGTFCSFQFMFGKMYSILSVKRVFLVSLIIFEIGSLLAGAAPTSTALVTGRAISGLGCAGVISGVLAMVTTSVPLRHRAFFGGLTYGLEGIASTCAPLLGGAITERASWRWCFYINLPLGALTFIAVAVFFQNPQRNSNQSLPLKQKIAKLDLLGTAIFVPSITSLLLALQWSGSQYGWGDARIIILFAIFLLLLAAFAWLQYYNGDNATLPPRIILQRSILSGMWFGFCNGSTLGVISYYMPIYFQSVKEVSPTISGILILPVVIGEIVSVLISGSGTTIIGYYAPFMILTSILTPIAAGLLTTLKVDASLASLICYQTLLGFGCGIGWQAPQVAAQTILSQKDTPIGIAAIIFAQNFGPSVFVSVAQTIFAGRLKSDLGIYAPRVNATMLEHMGLSELKSHIGSENLASALLGYDMAITQTFNLAVALTCLTLAGSVAMEWQSVKKKKT